MSKTKKKKQVAVKKKVVKKQVSESSLDKLISQDFPAVTLGIIVLLISFIHFGYSYLSNGFYQGEEAIHYMNMKKFWHEPSAILGNWGKPGWKLVMVIPALGGFKFLALFNAFIATLSAFFAYRLAQLKKVKIPLLAFILIPGQFLWMEMAFRNYSEFLSALVLVAAVYAHLKDKLILASFLLSYVLIMRQELLPVAALYAFYLIIKERAFIPVLLIGSLPLLFLLWEGLIQGDLFAGFTNASNYTSSILERYPRQGFDHYFKVSLPIFGPFMLVGFLAYTWLILTQKRKLDFFIIIPIAALVGIHCLINLQAFKIIASTGGNWRYLLPISPLLAVLAMIGWDHVWKTKNKLPLLILFIPFLIFSIIFNSYEHNYIGFSTVRDWTLPISVAVTILLAMLPLSKGQLVAGMAILTIAANYFYLKPIIMHGEDAKMKEIAAWVKQENIDDFPIYHSNLMLNVFMDKNEYEFEKGIHIFKSAEEIESAEVGSYIFWDTHYSKRYSDLEYTYFQGKSDMFQVIKQEQSDDKRFAILIFKKVK